MIGLLLWLLACGGGAPDAEVECDAERTCPWGQSCVDGQCEAGTCATSLDCPMEHHCDDSDCVAGCSTDSDCYPGEVCDEGGSCRREACEDTQLDCGFREFCDPVTGDCFDAGEQYCRPCTEDEECGEGNVCYGKHCGVDCSDTPCPSGFDCTRFVDDLGRTVAFQCITNCWVYREAGDAGP